MARKDFFDGLEIAKKVPGLKELIPVEKGWKVGISGAGNFKYVEPGENEKIISRKDIPHNLYQNLLNAMTGNDIPDAISSGQILAVKETEISFPLFRKLFPDIPVANPDSVFDVIVKGGKIYSRRHKKKKTVCDLITLREPQSLQAVIDLIKEVNKDKDFYSSVVSVIAKRKTEIKEAELEIRSSFKEKTEGVGKIRIATEGPCLYFYISLKNTQEVKRMFRLDKDENIQEIVFQWIDETVKPLVNEYNNAQYAKRFEHVDKAFIEELKTLLSKKQVLLEKCEISNTIALKASYLGGITLSTTSRATVRLLEKHVCSEPVGEIGRIQYALSEEGKKWVKTRAKEIYTNIIALDWKADGVPKKTEDVLRQEQVKYATKYDKAADALLWGKRTVPQTSGCIYFNIKNNSYSVSNKIATVTLKDGKTKTKTTDLYNETIKDLESKRCAAARRFIGELKKKHSETVKLEFVSGAGFLFGDTKINAERENVRIAYMWKTPSYKDSLQVWKKQAEKNMNELLNLLKEEQEKIRLETIRSLGTLAGNFIAIDAAEFILKNEKYITENATINYLRGLSQKFGGYIYDTDAYERYKPISSDDVEKVIDDMIRKGVIGTVTMKGTYGRFDILKPTDKSRMLSRKNCEFRPAAKIENILEQGQKISDSEAEKYFENFLKKEKPETSDYLKVMNLVQAKGFVCAYYDKYIDVLQSAPEDFKMYLKMRKDMSEDAFEKKVLIAVNKKKKGAKTTEEEQNDCTA